MMLENGDIYDGEFLAGMFHGNGVYFNFKEDSYTQAVFANHRFIKCLSEGFTYPVSLIGKKGRAIFTLLYLQPC